MKLLLLILTIFLINGCSQKRPECKPVPCEMIFPELPTYKTPIKKNFTKPVVLPKGMVAVKAIELKDVFLVNAKLRRITSNYAAVNVRVNKEYQPTKGN